MSTLPEKLFQQHQWNVLFIRAEITQILLFFGTTGFGEIKDHSLSMIIFQKVFLLWKFQVCVDLR